MLKGMHACLGPIALPSGVRYCVDIYMHTCIFRNIVLYNIFGESRQVFKRVWEFSHSVLVLYMEICVELSGI